MNTTRLTKSVRPNSGNPMRRCANRKNNGRFSARAIKEFPQVPPAPELQKVSFDWHFPNAKQVSIVGSFNDWRPSATPLKNRGGGRWELDIALEPERYEYRFVVDGQTVDDPGLERTSSDSSADHNSVLVVNS